MRQLSDQKVIDKAKESKLTIHSREDVNGKREEMMEDGVVEGETLVMRE